MRPGDLDVTDAGLSRPDAPLLEEALRAAPVGLATFDLALRCSWMNEALTALGVGPAAGQERGALAEQFPGLSPALPSLLRGVRDRGQPLEAEVEDPRPPPGAEPGGAPRTFRVACWPARRDGRLAGVAAVVTEITEQRRAWRESEGRFRLLVRTMPQIVCVLSPDGAPEYVNDAWTAFSGLDLQATRERGWAGVVHPDDLARVMACWRRVLAERTAQDLELRYRAADGGWRWYLCRLAPLVAEPGARVVQLVGAGLDIDELRRARDRERRAELRTRAVLTNIQARLLVYEAIRAADGTVADFRVVDASAEAVRAAARPREALVGRTVRELDGDGDAAAHARRVRVLERGEAETYERTEDGVTTLETVFRVDEATVGCSAVDISDRKRFEERLREADRRKDEFLGMLSHELRNPLAPIRNALYLIEQAAPGSGRARRAQAIAARQLAHLSRLVDDLLDVTRIARGKVQLRLAEVDVAEEARRVVDDHRGLFLEHAVALELRLPGAPIRVCADATRLAQVIGNLLQNAVKFTPRGGRVTLWAGPEGGEAVLGVRDTGAGMEPWALDAMFEPFVQGDQGLARTEGGLGLGLALVRGLVQLHGGTVHAASAGRGRGTEFVVRLPLAAGDPAAPSRDPDPAPGP